MASHIQNKEKCQHVALIETAVLEKQQEEDKKIQGYPRLSQVQGYPGLQKTSSEKQIDRQTDTAAHAFNSNIQEEEEDL